MEYCYNTTPSGHKVKLTLNGRGGPVLVTIHGGGLVRGSRRDDHVPRLIKENWPGSFIAIDYRLLVPSSGVDIRDDMQALLRFLPSLPISAHQIFLMGFSGGGYPLRLAAMLASEEAQRSHPAYTVRGCVSYFGMGGDLLHDYWFIPQRLKVSEKDLPGQQSEWAEKVARWAGSGAEYSDAPAGDMIGAIQGRNEIWEYWHMTGTINDAITGQPGFSAPFASTTRTQRGKLVPEEHRLLYPQLDLENRAARIAPFLLIHGDADQAVPYEESVCTWEALKRGGGRVEMITIKGGNHALQVNDKEPPETLDAYRYSVQWMLRQLDEA